LKSVLFQSENEHGCFNVMYSSTVVRGVPTGQLVGPDPLSVPEPGPPEGSTPNPQYRLALGARRDRQFTPGREINHIQ